jgi:hypothetical protein
LAQGRANVGAVAHIACLLDALARDPAVERAGTRPTRLNTILGVVETGGHFCLHDFLAAAAKTPLDVLAVYDDRH